MYEAIKENIPFYPGLVKKAPWIKIPDKPDWLDSATICSGVLFDTPKIYKAVALIKKPGQTMYIELSRQEGEGSIVCQGGTQDYEMRVIRDTGGEVVEMRMKAGESKAIIKWIKEEKETYFIANVDENELKVVWLDRPDESAELFLYFIDWLTEIGKEGGLIVSSDQPLIFLGLGELGEPFYEELMVLSVSKYIIADLLGGLPGTAAYHLLK